MSANASGSTPKPTQAESVLRGRELSRKAQRFREGFINSSICLTAAFSIFTTAAIVFVLITQTMQFFAIESKVMASQPSHRIMVAQQDGDWVATLSVNQGDEQADATHDDEGFTAYGVREGDFLDVITRDEVTDRDEDGKKVVLEEAEKVRAEIAAVEPRRLVLSGGIDAPAATGEAFTFEVKRDEVSFLDFITGTEWNPLLGAEKHFGIWPLICGTLLVTFIAMLVALPLGFLSAMYLSEYAPSRVRAILKPILEVLAGVPTVVYGFFALTVITPALRGLTGGDGFSVYNATSAGIAVGIMCLPVVTSLSEDAVKAVPNALREGAYGIGGTKFDVTLRVVFPAALSGVVAASLLAVARAVGETMIVALAAGNLAQLSLDPTDQTQTMTAYMVQIFLGDVSSFGIEYFSSYAVGCTLFVMTLMLTLIGHKVRVKFREEYE